jgi:thiol-disulfide isomerase/thioredoxin
MADDGQARNRVRDANRDRSAMLAVAAVAVVAGFSAVYLTMGRPDKVAPQAVPGIAPVTGPGTGAAPGTGAGTGADAGAGSGVVGGTAKPAGTSPLSVGHMTAFVFKKTPEPLPEVVFADASGKPMTLAAFKGRTVLLNLWATWCGPCRKEMPDLDDLQKALGSERFEVVALSIDRKGAEAAQKFLDSVNVRNLKLYIDDTARAGTTLKAVGMPTTILIGRDGLEIGRLVGPAQWDSDDAKRLIEASLK